MELSTFLFAAVITIGVLGYLLRRAYGETSRLRRRLESSAMDLQRLQLAFSRFVPDALVERIIASGIPTLGEKKDVTVLFSDLVGFTALSESVDPSTLVRILNGYFERMTRAITDHNGHISTLIGDGILALFGALEPNPWQANDAAHAALAMRAELEEYNRELRSEGLPTLSIGVGLHRGSGVAGLVGSEHLMEFTIVGRTINVAARVQDLTREHRTDILLTEEVRRALDPRFTLKPLTPTRVRGIARPVMIHAVQGFVSTSAN
jgi:adenylate cyclase